LFGGNLADEIAEGRLVDVVDEHEPAGTEMGPYRLHLEEHVADGMEAVVEEHIDLTELA
jgi:hypothetical protein